METALYPKDCKRSAAVSFPPLPRPQRPHEPLPPHPGSRLSAQQVTANSSRTDPAEAGLLGTSSSPANYQKPPADKPSPFVTVSPYSPALRAALLSSAQAGAGSIARSRVPANTFRTPQITKQEWTKSRTAALTLEASRGEQAGVRLGSRSIPERRQGAGHSPRTEGLCALPPRWGCRVPAPDTAGRRWWHRSVTPARREAAAAGPPTGGGAMRRLIHSAPKARKI